jgi:hypothetical protein
LYAVPVGVWLHTALVYNAQAQSMSIYVNGAMMGNFQLGGTLSVTANPTW